MSQAKVRAEARPIRFLHAIPILRIFDIGKAQEFYVDYLGFAVDWEHRFEPRLPVYMQVSRGDLTLHLSEHHGDCTPGSTVFVITTGLREFHREITAKRYPNLRPGIERMPWNADVMEVLDPFGNRIRFNEYIRERAQERARRAPASKSSRPKPVNKKSSRSND
jgi:hypothetical protein